MMSFNPMVEQVNLLIANRLFEGGDVSLPGVGTLGVEHRAARQLSKRLVEPPCRAVVFSSQERGESLPELIARTAQCSAEQAQEIYGRWLGRVRSDEALVIEGVGTLKMKHLTPDEAFDRKLNPRGHKPLKIRATRVDWVLWVGICTILFVVLSPGIMWWMDYMGYRPQIAGGDAATDYSASVAAASANAQAGSDFSDYADADSADAALGNDGSQTAEETFGNDGAHSGSGPQRADGSLDVAAAQHDGVLGNDGSQTAAGASGNSGPHSGSGSPDAVAAPRDGARSEDASASQPTLGAMIKGRCYVVLGVFSTVENARRAALEAQRKVPGTRCGIYPMGEKFMVSPFAADDAAACMQFIGQAGDAFPGMWPYTAR